MLAHVPMQAHIGSGAQPCSDGSGMRSAGRVYCFGMIVWGLAYVGPEQTQMLDTDVCMQAHTSSDSGATHQPLACDMRLWHVTSMAATSS